MPRSFPLNTTAQQVTSNPLNQLFFDPTSTIKSGQSAFQMPSGLQLLEELIQGWANFFDNNDGSLDTLVNQGLSWLDSATGLDWTSLLASATAQSSAINTFLNALFSGDSSSVINTDWSAVLTAYGYTGTDATLTSIWDWVGNMIAADNDYLTALYKAGSQLLNDVVAGANSTTLNADWTALMVALGLEPSGGFSNVWNTLIDAGWGTITTGHVTGVTETVYPSPVGHGALIATARATEFRAPGALSGHGSLVGPVGFVRELPVIGTDPDLPGHGVLSATVRAYQYRIPATLTGKGTLTARVPETITTSFIVGVVEYVYTDLFGHGSLTATATVKQFSLAPHLSGQGVLHGQVSEYFSVTATNIDSIGMDFFGHGQLTATAVVKEFILNGKASGHGALTAIVPNFVTTSFVLGIKEYLYFDQYGHGVLTVTATAKQFSLPVHITGQGVLNARVQEYFSVIATPPIDSVGIDFFGHGQLTATAVVKEFILNGSTSGHGQLTAIVPSYVTPSFIVGVKEYEYVDLFANGALSATVTVKEFILSAHLSGQGTLTGRVGDYIVFGDNIDSVGMDFFGHGQLTATAVVKEFILNGNTSGHGALTAVVPGFVTTSFILGVKEYLYFDQYGHGVLTATATAKQFRLAGSTAGQGTLVGQITEVTWTIPGSSQIDSIGMDFFGHGQLTATAVVKQFRIPVALPGKGTLTGVVPSLTTTSFVLSVKEAINLTLYGQGRLTATAVSKQFRVAAALTGNGLLYGNVPDVTTSSFVVGQKYGIQSFTSGHGVLSASAHSTKAYVTANLVGHGGITNPSGGPVVGIDQALINALNDALTGNLSGTLSSLTQAFDDLMTLLGNPFGLGTGSPSPNTPSATPLFGSLANASSNTVANGIFGGSTYWSSLMSLLFPSSGGSVGTAVTSTAVSNVLGGSSLGADVQSILDYIANALGHSGTGHTLTQIETYLGLIPAANVTNVLGGSNLGADITTLVNDLFTGAGGSGSASSAAIQTQLTNIWNNLFGTGNSPTTSAVPAANVTNVLGNGSLGNDLTTLATSLFGSATVNAITTTEQDIANFIGNALSGGTAPTSANSPVASLGTAMSNIPHTNVAVPPNPGSGAITHDAHANATAIQNGASGSGVVGPWNHTCASTANYLIVRLASYIIDPSSVTVTYNGLQMSLLASSNGSDNETYVQIYGLANPPTGAAYAVEASASTFFGYLRIAAGCSDSYIGVGSVGTAGVNNNINSGTNGSPSVAITSSTGDYVIGALTVSSTVSSETLSSVAGTTEYNSGNLTSASADLAFAANDAAGASTVTMNATASYTANNNWAACGVSLVPLSSAAIGSGFSAYRNSTSAVNVSSSSVNDYQAVPSGFYDTTSGSNALYTSDYSWNSSTQVLTVTNAGWYYVSMSFLTAQTMTSAGNQKFMCALYHQGSIVRTGHLLTCPGVTSGSAALSVAAGVVASGSWVVYLNAGDTLQPGSYCSVATFNCTGESTGSQCYFTVALANRSLA